MVAALPVLPLCQTDWSSFHDSPGARTEIGLGRDFIAANGERVRRLFSLARWACIPFSLIGACAVYLWGTTLYGGRAGLFGAALWCCDPNILGHGQLLTNDVAATATGLFAAFTYLNWLRRPSRLSALLAGVCLATCLLVKFTWIVLLPLWPLIWLAWPRLENQGIERRGPAGEMPSGRPPLIQLCGVLLVATIGVNLLYLFDGTGTRLGDYRFVSSLLRGSSSSGTVGNRFDGTLIGHIPVPLPAEYVRGFDAQTADCEDFPYDSYLYGRWREKGWWYYYLVASLVKVPLETWCLIGAAAVMHGCPWSRPALRTPWDGGICLFLPPACILIVASAATGFNHHWRYVLPCLGAAFVLAGAACQSAGRLARLLAVGAVVWSVWESACVYPHGLSYFNSLAGGPAGGHRVLLHSNIDWGQDLFELREWASLNSHARPLHLAYYGEVDPAACGLRSPDVLVVDGRYARPSPPRFKPGWYAVSVNFLHGDATSRMPRGTYSHLLTRAPDAMCGYSIYIYHLSQRDADELEAARRKRDLQRDSGF